MCIRLGKEPLPGTYRPPGFLQPQVARDGMFDFGELTSTRQRP
jgi:hypothetical protein